MDPFPTRRVTVIATHRRRAEDDWLTHCSRWELHHGGALRDNCLTNTDNLRNVFTIEGVPSGAPLYVAGELRADELGATRGLRDLVDPAQVMNAMECNAMECNGI